MARLRQWAQRWTSELVVLAWALHHSRTPWTAKVLAWAVVAYALSPLDLIPDFIPVLGHLDDLLLVPLGIWLVFRLIPEDVLAECRVRAAAESQAGRRSGRGCAVGIAALWLVVLGGIAVCVWSRVGSG